MNYEKFNNLIASLKEDPEREKHMNLLADAFYENIQRDDVEFGGLGLDSKRPFGNSDVERDLAEIIGLDLPDEKDEFNEISRYLYSLYDDLGLFLQYKWICYNL